MINTLTILFYIIVNIIILIIFSGIYTLSLENDNGFSTMSVCYLIALGIAFWFYFQTNQSKNILVGISFLIYLLIIPLYPYD